MDELTPGSPAASAGIQLGDQLLSFGDVTSSGDSASVALQRVAAALQAAHQHGADVQARFLRHGLPTVLTVRPQRWAGPGLLGCHLRPMGS